jgi:polyisoprenoid-binding protein YceI
MKLSILIMLSLLTAVNSVAQKYSTKTGKITFFSKAPLEDITATNNQVTAVLNAGTGEVAFVVVIRSFQFEKAAMQEHFNTNYLHSDKYPRATFEGTLLNPKAVNYSKPGIYDVELEGKLTIHGVTRDFKEKGQIEITGNNAITRCKFMVALVDFDIKNDKIKNIADLIEVTVEVELTKL